MNLPTQEGTEHYTSLSENLKIDPAKRPIVYVKGAEKLKYLYPEKYGAITPETVLIYLKAVENKKVKKYKLDEETRPGQQAATDQEL